MLRFFPILLAQTSFFIFHAHSLLRPNQPGEPLLWLIDIRPIYYIDFSEALEQVNRRLFCNGCPVVNMTALAEEEFKIAGEVMASSIVQGGTAPCFLSSPVYNYIVNGVGSIQADDADEIVENLHLKNAINKVPLLIYRQYR